MKISEREKEVLHIKSFCIHLFFLREKVHLIGLPSVKKSQVLSRVQKVDLQVVEYGTWALQTEYIFCLNRTFIVQIYGRVRRKVKS